MPVTIHELFVTDTWRVEISGLTIGVFTHCTGLRIEREMLDYAEGGNNDQIHHLPGRVRYGSIKFSRGLTDEKAMLDWFFKPADKKEVTVTLEQGGGTLKRGWTFADAYPVAWSGPDLDAGAADVASETLEIEGGSPIECAFNPQSYTVSKTNVWTFKPTTGVDLPKGEFGGGLPRRTKLALLLDVSLAGDTATVKDQANNLLKMMETGGGGGGGGGSVPPFVTFRWGSVDLPKSVPVSLSIQYVLFHPNGEPIRALVDLELAQAEKASTASSSTANAPTNPHTESIRGLRSHRVRDGDSLHSIAYDAYGDPFRWRVIAEANGIDDPTRLRRGRDLTIPTLDN